MLSTSNIIKVAHEQGYVLYPKGDALRYWGEWCENNRLPHIVAVKQSDKNITVEMDLFYVPRLNRLSPAHCSRVAAIHDLVSRRTLETHAGSGGLFSFYHVPAEYVEFVCKSFLAIYNQNQGGSDKVPKFPAPINTQLVSSLQKTLQQGFVYTHGIQNENGVRFRYAQICEVSRWPYVHLWEPRRGRGAISISMPRGIPLTPVVQDSIHNCAIDLGIARRRVSDMGIASARKITKASDMRYVITNTGMRCEETMPIGVAYGLMTHIISTLRNAGYFSSLDVSWHL